MPRLSHFQENHFERFFIKVSPLKTPLLFQSRHKRNVNYLRLVTHASSLTGNATNIFGTFSEGFGICAPARGMYV
jgi:hypothetical protein